MMALKCSLHPGIITSSKFMCQYGAIQGNHICQEEQTLTFTRCTFKGLEKIMSLMLSNLSKN